MDVIGDEVVPGKATYELGIRRPLMVVVLGALVSVAAAVAAWFWNFGPAGGAIALTMFCGLVAVTYVSNGYIDQWRELYSDYRNLRAFAIGSANQSVVHGGFIKAFRPPQGEIDRVLTAAAYEVLKAHEAQVKFYAKGAGDYGERLHRDPEDEVYRLRVASEAFQRQLNQGIAKALDLFRGSRDLAKAQAYKVHESWKDYISPDLLPRQLKKSKSDPVELAKSIIADYRDGNLALDGRNK